MLGVYYDRIVEKKDIQLETLNLKQYLGYFNSNFLNQSTKHNIEFFHIHSYEIESRAVNKIIPI